MRRYQCVVTTVGWSSAEQDEPKEATTGAHDCVTAACWVGARGDCFATGHESGVIRVWGLPEAAAGVCACKSCISGDESCMQVICTAAISRSLRGFCAFYCGHAVEFLPIMLAVAW